MRNKWIDLSQLPRKYGFGKNKDKLVIDWKNCSNYKCKFGYENIEGEITLLKADFKEDRVYFIYNEKEYDLSFSGFLESNFKTVVGIHDFIYKYDKDDIINVPHASFLVLERTSSIGTNGCKKSAYNVKCLKCGYVYKLDQDRIKKLQYCPVCINRVVAKGINDIWTTHPEIASLLTDKNDGYKYCKNSCVKLYFTCKYCGESSEHFLPMVSSTGHVPCSCSNSYSLPNKIMFYLLKETLIKFEKEKTFDWSEGKRYDFYIEGLSTIIEMHGAQHYQMVSIFDKTENDFIQRRKNDKWKQEMAALNNVDHYIVIDCRVNTFEYILKNILSSDLSNMINFSSVNMNIVKKNVFTNICEIISKYWNDGIYETKVIAKNLGLTSNFVVNKLHLCHELGLINYDKSLSKSISQKNVIASRYQHLAKPLKCNELDMYFGNVTTASKILSELLKKDMRTQSISRVLSGQRKSYKKYTFSYVSRLQFNKIKEESPKQAFGDLFFVEEDIYDECVS